jgi:hypothetical protein
MSTLGEKCGGPKALRKCGRVAADFLAERIRGKRNFGVAVLPDVTSIHPGGQLQLQRLIIAFGDQP